MTDISLPITTLAAIINGLILIVLTFRVIILRRRDGVVLGDNDDRVLAKAIRGHGNATEQMPMALICLALAELQGAPFGLLAALAGLFTLGRILHATYFGKHGTPWQLRFYGMWATLIAQAGLLVVLLGELIA